MTVTSVEAARGLQNNVFLGHFLESASPSDVGKKLDMPANLAHHHAKAALETGILLEMKRKGGKVFYQLVAHTFRYARDLLTQGNSDDPITQKMARIKDRFLHEYQRCDTLWSSLDGYYHYVGFGTPEKPPLEILHTSPPSPLEGIPAHLDLRSLRLSTDAYVRLMRELSRLIAAEPDRSAGSLPCTVTLLGFAGPLEENGIRMDIVQSFIPPLEPIQDPS